MTENRNIPFARPWITDLERHAALEVLKGDILTHGPQNKAFEEEFSSFTGGGYSVALSSCMAALHLAYWQMGIGTGDDVIVAAQTHVATAHAVEVAGARPIFVDCEPETGNIDPVLIEDAITPHTRAIGLVHFLGIPCDMEQIMKIASEYNLKVVEDCALSVGSRYKGIHTGLMGSCGCFSFYPVKHITTGDGGMFVSNNRELAEKVGKARAFGVNRVFSDRSVPGMYDVPTLGINYRMSDINASIGRVQLSRIGEILKRREHNFMALKRGIGEIGCLKILDSQNDDSLSSHYCLTAALDKTLSGKRDLIVKTLNQRGIGTSIYYPQPVPRMSYYREKYGYDATMFPCAEMISDCSIALPVGPHISDDDIDYMVDHVHQTIQENL
jgi:dTDP-4-amino-4,6-dideoxygalactose transaminase